MIFICQSKSKQPIGQDNVWDLGLHVTVDEQQV